MKKFIAIIAAALALAVGSGAAQAEPSDIDWRKAPVNTRDNGSLQRGAGLFVNYCLNCHSAAFMRWNRLEDIGLSEKQIKDYFLNVDEEAKGTLYGQTMKAAIDPVQAKEWFGANPPDLTVIARSRAGKGTGADYLYTYMTTFYPDDQRPTGWNNLFFPNVGMPHVLWQLQGSQKPVMQAPKTGEGEPQWTGKWETVSEGQLSPAEYDRAVADLVNYLQWMGEPAQNKRKTIGAFVLGFLALLAFITHRLNAAFWREVK